MGYISMVPIYQYQEYSKRTETAPKTQAPITVNEIERLDITSKFHRTFEERLHAPVYKEQKKHQNYTIAGRRANEAATYLASKITGIGQNINYNA